MGRIPAGHCQVPDPSGESAWKLVCFEQGLWALPEYRISASVYRSTLPRLVRVPLRSLLTLWHKLIEVATGISLPCTARIGPALHLPHPGARVVHGQALIGAGGCITQGVTIGVSGRGARRGVPVIADRVFIGPNAVVVGKILVGNEVVVDASFLVNRDVPPGSTVVGVPAVVVNTRGSADYLRGLDSTDPERTS